MGIIYVYAEGSVSRIHALQPPRYAPKPFQSLNDTGERDPGGGAQGRRAHSVVHGEKTGNMQADTPVALGRKQMEGSALGGDLYPPGIKLSGMMDPHSPHGDGQAFFHVGRRFIVSVENGNAALGKKLLFGSPVIFKCLVIIQVILRQVGKQSRFKGDSRHPLLRQRMGGYLHDHQLHSLVGHAPQQGKQIYRFRRGTFGIYFFFPDKILNGANKAHLFPGSLGNGFDHIGHGSLSVGAGNSQHGQLPLRMPVKACGSPGHGLPAVRNDQLRHIQRQGTLADQGRSTLFHRHGGKVVPIGLFSYQAAEQTAPAHLSGIVIHGGYLRLRPRILYAQILGDPG